MTFGFQKQDDRVVVSLPRQLIIENRQELKQKVLDRLERGDRRFLIDFGQTGYIDSSGLGLLVTLTKAIREKGGDLRFANVNADLQSLFELTKLDTLLPKPDERDEPAGPGVGTHPSSPAAPVP